MEVFSMKPPTKQSSGATTDPAKSGLALSPLSRRTAIKSLGMAAGALLLPAGFSGTAIAATLQAKGPAKNPKWYGFNLLEYFSTDPDWMKYFPYRDDGMFPQNDFRWIRDWGFNWVRLPMDYRFWTAPDLFTIDEEKIEPIDRAVRLGEKYHVHINICLHCAPRFCILATMEEQFTGSHITKEKASLYYDPAPPRRIRLSVGLLRRPLQGDSRRKAQLQPRQRATRSLRCGRDSAIEKQRPLKTPDFFNSEMLQRHARDYVRVASAAGNAIRAHEPQRLVVTDGYPGGGFPVPGLFANGMLQSGHTYNPMPVTHHDCEWVRGGGTATDKVPTWPMKNEKGNIVCDRQELEKDFHSWAGLAVQGVPIHFGELGCYKHTPPEVVLAWFNDTLDVLGELNSGWALWNFRGPFG